MNFSHRNPVSRWGIQNRKKGRNSASSDKPSPSLNPLGALEQCEWHVASGGGKKLIYPCTEWPGTPWGTILHLDGVLKGRDTTLLTKVHLVKAMVFPVVMYGRESWTIKKAESWRIDAFELWCWRRLFSLLDCEETQPVYPKGNQSWMFIERTDAEAETPNTLPTWWEELTHWKRPWCWERLKPREGDDRGWDGWIASPTWWTWVWTSSGSWWWTGRPGMLQSMGSQRVRND